MSSPGHQSPEMKEDEFANGDNGSALNRIRTRGAFMAGPYKKKEFRQFANPAPLGLCGFALTTFILSLINVGSRGIHTNSVVLGCAYAYGGLVQLLAGMWEMAVGNTFGATALSSYGGFWISFAIMINQSYGVIDAYSTPGLPAEVAAKHASSALGFYLTGWWIFTTILLFCTLRSTVAFFFLFLTLDLAFLMLSAAHFITEKSGAPGVMLTQAGGVFGLMAAFLAWYNALVGLVDEKNSWFTIPVVHLPWSETGKQRKLARSEV